jgi:hypothetical protein
VTSLAHSIGSVYASNFDAITNAHINSLDTHTSMSLERARASALALSVHHLTVKHTTISALEGEVISARYPRLRVLDMSHNCIKHMSAPLSLTHLRILSLKSNALTTLSGIQTLTALSALDISCNKLIHLQSSIHMLVPLSASLCVLDSSFNEICKQNNYVDTVMSILPRLTSFDGRNIASIVQGYAGGYSIGHKHAQTEALAQIPTNQHFTPPPLPLEQFSNWDEPESLRSDDHYNNQSTTTRRRLMEQSARTVSGISSFDSVSALYAAEQQHTAGSAYGNHVGASGVSVRKSKMIRKPALPTQAGAQPTVRSQSPARTAPELDTFEAQIRRAYLRQSKVCLCCIISTGQAGTHLTMFALVGWPKVPK